MREIKRVGIAGGGTMGSSMAKAFAQCGYEVVLYDIFESALEKAKDRIGRYHVRYTTDLSRFMDVDFVVEAIVEKLEVKEKFWEEVSQMVDEDVVLASNTSGLSITAIAKVIKKPERFGGMHWINPPDIIPLIEVISGEKTSKETADTIYNLCLNLGKKPVAIKDAPGFALNRIQFAIIRECLYIAEQGIASPEDIDKVMKYALGVRYACLGPLEVADHGGLDVFYNISSYLFEDLCDAKKPFGLLKEAYENGNYGVKSGKGFYDYSEGRDKEAIIYRDNMYTRVSKCLFE